MNFDCKVCSLCGESYSGDIFDHKCTPRIFPPINFPPKNKIEISQADIDNSFRSMWYCKCGNRLSDTRSGSCWECKAKEKAEKKRKWLVDRKYGMTMEERIAAIESFMYDFTKGDVAKQIDTMRMHTTVFR